MSPVDAKLLERLLTDRVLRARFRRDPAGTARDAGYPDLADRLALHGTRALEALDPRESRSSVAGVMLAAAVEGLGLFELAEHLEGEAQVATPSPSGQPAVNDELPVESREAGDEPHEEEPDEEEPDEEEPDEEEPDEEEPDEDEDSEYGGDDEGGRAGRR